MPKRNKLPPMPDYIGTGGNFEKLLIQKSNPLLTLSETEMTLPELKILDAYLSRINSREPEKRHVRFEKGELEQMLDVTRILPKDLDKRINNLFQIITIKDETKINGFKKISLFEKVECGQDENGLWQVDLMCTPSAMEYIFNIENLGYLKYRLKSVVNLKSRYSYVLYLFLESNCYRKNIEFALDELKNMLNCHAKTFLEFKEFNKQILKKCQKEINEKTDISYTYTTVKKGRKVVAISFEVERKPRIESSAEPATPVKEILEHEAAVDISSASQPVEPPRKSGFHSLEQDFTPEEIQTLIIIINAKLSKPNNNLANKILSAKYAECKLTCPNVEKPFAYFLASVTKMSVEEFEKKKSENNDGFDADKYDIVVNNF